jgi:hypothetical protein
MIPVSKPEHFLEKVFAFNLTMVRILGAEFLPAFAESYGFTRG